MCYPRARVFPKAVLVLTVVGLWTGSGGHWATVAAQPPASPQRPVSPTPDNGGEPSPGGGWRLEALRLTDGKELRGLVRSENDTEVEFVEVVQAQGKPIYLVIRPIARQLISAVERLPLKARKELARRIYRFRHRSRIELGRMEDVRLQAFDKAGVTWRRYEGRWFRLQSTAGDETTRRCVVRIEQIFRAYSQFLPPRFPRHRDLAIRLYGSTDEYQAYLRQLGVNLRNPAFYSSSKNVIVAGSELSRFAARLAEVRRRTRQTLDQHAALDAALPARLALLAQELVQNGLKRDEIRDEVAAQRRAWNEEYAEVQKKCREVERRNTARFADVTRRMFTRLYHEAFHAYLENNVYPSALYDVPTWLNEGLAQIFESGQLDAGVLRIDAPARENLLRLQDDLRGTQPLPLKELLSAHAAAFLVNRLHERNYDYSWGLAYYLTFQQDLLGTEQLHRYVSREAAALPPVVRFEQLVGMPLSQFTERWYEALLATKPPPR